MKTLKIWSLFSAVILLGMMGLGCGKQGSPAIRISSWGDVKENLILTELINDFMKAHPDIKVELLRVPYNEYMTKLFSQVAGGNAPDVIFVSTDDVLNLASRGTLEPLDEYIKASPDFPLNDFFPNMIEDFTVDNHLYVIPRDSDPQYDVYYNKKAFDEAHLPYPSDEWTWDDFLKDAKALTKKDAKGNTVRWGFTDDVPRIEPWIYTSGGRWVDNSLQPTQYTFNTPEFIRGLQFRADLILKHKVTPGPSNLRALGGTGTSDLFSTGAAAMFFSGLWHTPEFRDIKTFDWDIAMFPKGPEGKKGFSSGGSGYGVLSSSKNKKAAWEVVRYIAGPEGEKKMAASGLVVPALRSVTTAPEFLDGKPPVNKKALMGLMPYGILLPRTLNWREVSEGTIAPTFDKIWLGELTAQEAVSQLYEKLKKMPPLTKQATSNN